MRYRSLIFIAFLLSISNVRSQSIDSLFSVLQKTKTDTSRCALYISLGEQFSVVSLDSTLFYWDRARNICENKLASTTLGKAEHKVFTRLLAKTLLNTGVISIQQAKIPKALDCFKKCLTVNEELKNVKMISDCYNNMAYIYESSGDVPRALEYNLLSLKIREKIKDKKGVATTLNNLAVIYERQGDLQKTHDYFERARKLYEETNDKKGIARMLNNIAGLNSHQGNFAKALENYNACLNLFNEINDKAGVGTELNNIGVEYLDHGDPAFKGEKSLAEGLNKSFDYFQKSLVIREELQDVSGTIHTLNNLGKAYYHKKNFAMAVSSMQKAMVLGEKLGSPEHIGRTARQLTFLYKEKRDFKPALENFELYIKMRDSINNAKTRKASIRSQLKYEYEKQAAADSVAHLKEREIKNVELARQRAEIKAKKNQQYALFGGLFLVCLFGIFMYNRFKVTQKQKVVIEHQKEIVEGQKKLVEQKQHEILDSIKYARRIQMAQIPSEKRVLLMLNKLKRN